MRHFLDENKTLRAIEPDGSQDFLITEGWKELTVEEAEAIRNPPLTPEQVQQSISSAIQMMLDTKAQSLRYDNMMSVRSYAGYANPFQAEAQYLAVWGANCWVKAGQIQADVEAGKRPMPTVDQVLEEMPVP